MSPQQRCLYCCILCLYMYMKRVKVIIFGMFPTLLSACISSEDIVKQLCKPIDVSDQLRDYPDWMLNQQLILADIISLLSNFAPYIDIDVVGADTLRGIFLSLKYKLGSQMAVIIGDRVFKEDDLVVGKIERYVRDLVDNLVSRPNR